MASIKSALTFAFVTLISLFKCNLAAPDSIPLVCPRTCDCNGSDILTGPAVIFFGCENYSYFKYNPEKGKLYPLNKEAVNASILNKFEGHLQLYIDNLNLTSIEPDILENQIDLKIFSLTGNDISSIPTSVFANLFDVWAIVLSNNKLRHLPFDQLPNPFKLRRIFFDGNYLQLSDDLFSPYYSLEWLYLSYNNLTSLPQTLIYNLSSLQLLDLSSNFITVIPPFFFSRSKSLTSLDLSRNNLLSLSDDFSWGLFILRQLMLFSNNLTSISDSSFNCLWRLQNLTLAHNKIREIGHLAFYSLQSLLYLDLSNNQLEIEQMPILPSNVLLLRLQNNIFNHFLAGDWSRHLKQLVDLDLSGNNITYLDMEQFSFVFNSDKTQSLIRTYNSITHLHGGYLKDPFHSQVNLTGNAIREVNVQRFKAGKINPNPTNVYLSKNPFTENCACQQSSENLTFTFSIDDDKCEDSKICNGLEDKCPRNCTCVSSGIVDCSMAGLSIISTQMSLVVGVLSMDFNNLTDLSSLLTPVFNNLKELHLRFCFILTDNLIIPSNISVFNNLEKLKTLTLSHNLISLIPKNIFSKLYNLQVLDLSYNMIEYLSNSFWSHMETLKKLNLENNKLKAFDISNQLPNLKYLNLASNEIENISNLLTSIPNITELVLSSNNINHIEHNWPESLILILLNNNNITAPPNKEIIKFPLNLKRLDLASNQLDFFSTEQYILPNGSLLDLSKNLIKSVNIDTEHENYYQIIITENPFNCSCELNFFLDYIRQPKKKIFLEFPNVATIKCAMESSTPESIFEMIPLLNCHISCPKHCSCHPNKHLECTKIPMQLKDNAWHTLSLKNIEFESLKTIESDLWSNLSSLSIVQCNGCNSRDFSTFKLGVKPLLTQFTFVKSQVNFLPAAFLSNATDLHDLYLSENEIQTLPLNFFASAVKIQILDLSFNKLKEIKENYFSYLAMLEELRLNGNSIDIILPDVFTNNKNLQKLDIANNRLTKIDPNAFLACSNLQELNMERNYIGKEELNHLNLPSTLKFLYLGTNKIDKFLNNWKYLNSLEKLDLSHNLITSIDIEDFIGYPHFLLINLTANEIGIINYNRDIQIYSQPNIILNYPINCNCKIKWLVQCLRNFSSENCPVKLVDADLECQSPENVTSQLVKDLDEDELTCVLDKCETGCECYEKSELNIVNCSHVGKSTLPQVLPDNVHVLILDGTLNLTLRGLKDEVWKGLKKLYVSFSSEFESDQLNGLLVHNEMLQVVWFTFNGLESLPENIFTGLINLKEVNLSGNKLSSLPAEIFNGISLQTLNLSRNNLKFENNSLPQLYELKSLDLSYNEIANLTQEIVEYYVLQLNLSHNKISKLPISNDISVQMLDLGYNHLTSINLTTHNFNDTFINLQYNQIHKMYLPSIKTNLTVDISNTPISCHCHYIEEPNQTLPITIINEHHFCAKKTTEELNTVFTDPTCIVPNNCDFCTCIKQIPSKQLFMHCSNNMQSLPSTAPPNVTTLALEHTNMTSLSGLSASHWANLKTLYLSHNRIKEISNENLPSNLTLITLNNNKLERPSGWLSNFPLLSSSTLRLTLSQNPWICDCQNEEFSKWLLNDGKSHVDDFINVTCFNGMSLLNDLCEDNVWTITGPILTIIMIILVMSIVFLSFYCKHKSAVHMYLFAHCKCCKWWVTEEDVDADKLFDAFVAYAGEDGHFVADRLVPELEEKPPYYKLCIHERDWLVGEQIVDQIEASVLNSRRIIILLSKYFVNSMWSSVEFKTAHYHSLQDRMNRIIVVVIGELPPKESLDADLRLYINLNTYLKWDDKQFMDKLRYAMPRKTCKKKMKEKTVVTTTTTTTEL